MFQDIAHAKLRNTINI